MARGGVEQLRAKARLLSGVARFGVEWITTGVTYNPLSRRVIDDPYPTYRWLRARDPVHWSGMARGWLLLRHADAERVLRDHERFSSDLRRDPLMAGRTQVIERPSMLTLDAPDHTRLRGLVIRAFTPSAIRAMRPRVEALVDEHLDALAPRGELELMESFAQPLPVIVIAEMLGIPPEDRARFKLWSDALARTIEPMISEAARQRGRAAALELRGYFKRAIARRRGGDQDDLLSSLLRVSDDETNDRLDEDELVSLLRLLLIAGNETTTNLIGNGVLALLRSPDALAWLQGNPERVGDAIEELLRFDSPVQLDRRFAKVPLELGGRRIRPGQRVFPVLGAANHDPDVFDEPDLLRLDRRPRAHISFGRGIHHCLGAALARLEGAAAIGGLVRRFPRLRLAGAPRFRPQVLLRGLSALPIALA